MFEYLKQYVGENKHPNSFSKVNPQKIAEGESRLGFTFPSQLKQFYQEIGYGFLGQGTEDKRQNRSLVNRVLSPTEIAALLCDEENVLRPDEGFLNGVMPFFDTGENTYLVLRPTSKYPNRVYWPDGKQQISSSLEEFFKELSRHADFFLKE